MRKLAKVKKDLIKNSTISLAVSAIFAGIIFGIVQYKSSKKDELKKVESEITKIKSKIASIKNERKGAMLSYETFNSIPKNKLPTDNGYETSVQRQIIAKKILIELSDKYRFTTMDPKLTPPKFEESTELTDIISSSLVINFDGMSDELVFAFISDMQKTLPGYLKLTKLNIKRKANIDDKTLQKIELTGTYLPLVSGVVEFKWYTLKNRKEAENK